MLNLRRFNQTVCTMTVTLAIWGAVCTPAWAQSLADRVVEHHYPNGLTLLMVERHVVPTVSCNVTFRVGGVNEKTGMTGIAHLYEHMAFKGTTRIGTRDYASERRALARQDAAWRALQDERTAGAAVPADRLPRLQAEFEAAGKEAARFVAGNELAMLYSRNGGLGLNATTGKDLTRYVISLPSNRLELWAAIESERLAHPVLREFYSERDVVLEERRLRYENSPSGRLYEAFLATAFWAHPYGMPVIGWTSDIQNLQRDATEEFFRAYYVPNNTIITLVGDLDPKATIDLVGRYFGGLASRPLPREALPQEPEQRGERRVEVEFAAEPSLLLGYHTPDLTHADDAVLDVIDSLLSDGRSSRLYRALVRDQRLALSVSTSTGVPGARYPHLFVIDGTPRAPHTAHEVEAAIEHELERLKTDPIEPAELRRILNQLDASLIRSLRSNAGLASMLGYFQGIAGDWHYLLRNREAVSKVGPEDIHRVAQRYFVRSNKTAAMLVRVPESVVNAGGGS